jgi:protein involved in polysaccharide export with SLBB domain
MTMNKLKWILQMRFLFLLTPIIFLISGCASNLSTKSHRLNPERYKIRAGDVIEVKFGEYTDFNQMIIVYPNGKAPLRALGEVKIAGLTPEAFESLLKKAYGSILIKPDIKVNISKATNFKVYIGGEVQRPGMISFKGKLTVAQSILMAGGLKNKTMDFDVLIFRNQGWEGVKKYKIKLREKTSKNEANRNFELAPYDVVYVLKAAKVKFKKGRLI